MIEIWKDIKGYEGIYQISNLGSVKSLERYVNTFDNNKRIQYGKILKQSVNFGYCNILLHNDSIVKMKKVHRLVAEAFIPNPLNKPVINHIDGDKRNNYITNLEWCTIKENNQHAYKNGLKNHDYTKKAVKQIENGIVIAIYNSQTEASRQTGIHKNNISDCCKGGRKTGGGYKWEYHQGILL